MHEQHEFKCPPLYPSALILSVLLVFLALFQGPLCQNRPEAQSQALGSQVVVSSRRLSSPLQVSPESWGRGGVSSREQGSLGRGAGQPPS